MIDSGLTQLFLYAIGAGAAGSLLGALVGYFSRDESLKVGTSSGVGGLIGASLGAIYAIFGQMAGRL